MKNSLNFDTNKINFIDENVFKDLINLRIHYLNGNKLINLSSDIFVGLYNLEKLSLSSNELEFIHSETFKDMTKLTNLDLSLNNLKTVNIECLIGLEILNLYTNKFEFFKTNLTSLRTLNLQNNYLKILNYSIFETDTSSSNLTVINLCNCRINFIGDNIFQNLSKLNEINLENNLFTYLNESVLRGLSQLKRLALESDKQLNECLTNLSLGASSSNSEISSVKIVDYEISSSNNSFNGSDTENNQNDVEFYDESELDESKSSIDREFDEFDSGQDDSIVLSKTTKEKPKIFYQDYEYIMDKEYKGKIYWKCSFNKPQCKARIHTNLR
ncbi:unnamed protein product [Brachionus calyciflorus]|uniref:FLYWCH-type domain-containing protein n=1 Tax=Brachionus calyciflorus TaxID=104777 RepID=A0A813NQV1_9BILA|nr:unnamed protein product [Brachionus calyciflorus]